MAESMAHAIVATGHAVGTFSRQTDVVIDVAVAVGQHRPYITIQAQTHIQFWLRYRSKENLPSVAVRIDGEVVTNFAPSSWFRSRYVTRAVLVSARGPPFSA